MIKLIDAVESMPLGSDPLLGPALLALTDMISDPYPGYSVIPAAAASPTTGARCLGRQAQRHPAIAEQPGARHHFQFSATIAAGEHRCWAPALFCARQVLPGLGLCRGSPFVQAALSGLRTAGLDPQMRAYRFCTNGASSAGVLGIPTVGFGPAAEADAHVVDERLAIVELLAAAGAGLSGIVAAVLCYFARRGDLPERAQACLPGRQTCQVSLDIAARCGSRWTRIKAGMRAP